jgi:pilus assembly protein Flp/PilA
MNVVLAALRRFAADESGATAIEYGLIAALVAVVAIVAMTSFGNNLSRMFNTVETRTSTVLNRDIG